MSVTSRRKILIGFILLLVLLLLVVLSSVLQPPPDGKILIDSENPNMGLGINDEGRVRGILVLKNVDVIFFTWTPDTGLILLKKKEEFDRNLFRREANNLGQRIENIEINEENHAFVIQKNGDRYKLPLLGGDAAYAEAINNKGQVVGYIVLRPPWWKQRWNAIILRLDLPHKYMFSTSCYNSAKAAVWEIPLEGS